MTDATQLQVATAAVLALQIVQLILNRNNAKNIRKIEVATNSMKDALVKATEKEALARGIKQGAESERESHL